MIVLLPDVIKLGTCGTHIPTDKTVHARCILLTMTTRSNKCERLAFEDCQIQASEDLILRTRRVTEMHISELHEHFAISIGGQRYPMLSLECEDWQI